LSTAESAADCASTGAQLRTQNDRANNENRCLISIPGKRDTHHYNQLAKRLLRHSGNEAFMKVPFAKTWEKETSKLRKIALDCYLTEEQKWGKPCFTYQGKNVAIVIPLKESCAFSFFKGALLKDPKNVLLKIGEHTQAGRWIKFTSVKEITALQTVLSNYIYEAIGLEESGKKVKVTKPSDYPVAEELQALLDGNASLKAAFEALTPGRRKSYSFHISGAKQEKTRVARAEKCVPLIMSGRGFNELPS
jgi:uncharacterized protein YdeI (YjbR/CyaY-like superfamily)